jgi:ABC-type nickel/cobalt efflux system permease component RcnA
MRARIARSVVAAALGALLLPALVAGHPLGNFTINHFAGLHVSADRILVDLVIDRAEIPAYEEHRRLDRDGNGVIDAAEASEARRSGCTALLPHLSLLLDGQPLPLTAVASGLTFPEGAAGLPTMRLVCELESRLPAAIRGAATLTFEDRSFAERIGWREIVAVGNGVVLDALAVGPGGASNRLTAYPQDLLAQPPDVRAMSLRVTPGGVPGPAWKAPDAQRLEDAAVPAAVGVRPVAAVPGGVAEDLAALVNVADLTPVALLVSLLVAIGLGMAHAVSPGHGKTIMAAYLLGSRGTARQALGLGLAVAASHTAGVTGLALLSIAAAGVLPADRLYPVLATASGGLVVVIGANMLRTRLRELRSRAGTADHGHEHPHPHDHHGHPHDHHGHPHDHHGHPQHPTLPGPSAGVSWRGLVAIGLSGGLVPSASALILLLGSVAAGRVAYGLVLVVGFGAGMAVVLAGVGLVVLRAGVVARKLPSAARLRSLMPLGDIALAGLILVVGVVLTGQAISQVR